MNNNLRSDLHNSTHQLATHQRFRDVCRDLQVSASTATMVYVVLLSYSDGTAKPVWPNLRTIAAKAACSYSTAKRARRALKEAGLIKVTRRRWQDRKSTQWRASSSKVHFEAPEWLVGAVRKAREAKRRRFPRRHPKPPDNWRERQRPALTPYTDDPPPVPAAKSVGSSYLSEMKQILGKDPPAGK